MKSDHHLNQRAWQRMRLMLVVMCGLHSLAQSGISGSAPVQVMPRNPECAGTCPAVDIFVDVNGLSGVGGDAGLNAFVLAFDLSRTDVFAYAVPGQSPISGWTFVHTDPALVDVTNTVIVTGAVGDDQAPNQSYHVATLVFCGDPGSISMSFNAGLSSLGSRVVNDDGPGPISIAAPSPTTIQVTTSFPLNISTGVASWLLYAPTYDLVAPSGPVDVLDLSRLVQCGH